jgi:hypothetical protein
MPRPISFGSMSIRKIVHTSVLSATKLCGVER